MYTDLQAVIPVTIDAFENSWAQIHFLKSDGSTYHATVMSKNLINHSHFMHEWKADLLCVANHCTDANALPNECSAVFAGYMPGVEHKARVLTARPIRREPTEEDAYRRSVAKGSTL